MAGRSSRKIPPLAIVSLILVAEIGGLIGVQFSFGRDPFKPNELQLQNFARLSAVNDRLVFAPYYYFYDNATGRHVGAGGNYLTDIPYNNGSNLDGFSGTNESWHAYEIFEMTQAKIDVCLPYFSYSFGNPTEIENELACLKNLSAGYQKLVDWGQPAASLPKIALYLNTSSLFQAEINAHGTVDISIGDPYTRFATAIKAFYDCIPLQYRFNYHNIPNATLVWLDSNTNWINHADDQLVVNLTAYYPTIEDKASLLIVGDETWADIGVINLHGYTTSDAALSGPYLPDRPGIRIATIGPGFNNTGAVNAGYATASVQTKSRAGGEFYNNSWKFAMTQQAAWVFIESWNDLHDGSEISPTNTYSDLYVNLTSVHVTSFKNLADFTSDVLVFANFAITTRMFFIMVMVLILGGSIGITLYLAFVKYALHRRLP